MEQDKEFHLSFSRIAIYNECPLRYKYIYVDKLPVKARSYFSFGSTIHKVLELFYHPEENFKKKNKPPLEYLLSLLEEHWISAGYKTENEEKKAKEEAKKILTKIYRENIFGFKPAYIVEKSFSFELDKFKVIGRIDRIDELKDGYKIIDYKTNRLMPRFFREIDLLQPVIYKIAAERSLGLNNIKSVSLIFVRFNKEVKFSLPQGIIEKGIAKIIETGNNILAEKFDPLPNGKCSTCEFRNICPVFEKNVKNLSE